ncbi:hypothetical protein HYV31_02340 [candidate division WWE3 bacterium]|nr:hypothetical protein [candidate division WWE3 bacterium]
MGDYSTKTALNNVKCQFCHKEITQNSLYCAFCGQKQENTNIPLSTAEKIKIYTITVLLAPIGLYWFFKYYKSTSNDKRNTAYWVLGITIAVIVLTLYISADFYRGLSLYETSIPNLY